MPSEEIRYYEENVYSIEIASCARARVSDRFVLYGVACRVVSYRLVSSRLVQEESVCTQGESNVLARKQFYWSHVAFPIIYRTYQD